jgi:hypothetical protein
MKIISYIVGIIVFMLCDIVSHSVFMSDECVCICDCIVQSQIMISNDMF